MRTSGAELVVTEWIRAVKGQNKPPDLEQTMTASQGISFYVDLHPDPSTPIISTPTNYWSGGGDVQYACSFCRETCRGQSKIQFNPVMSHPYMLICGQCELKMR